MRVRLTTDAAPLASAAQKPIIFTGIVFVNKLSDYGLQVRRLQCGKSQLS